MACCAISFCASALALDSPASDAAKPHWQQAKAALKQGAYRTALESLDEILKLTPDDPWAQLYHALCELRLKSTPTFSSVEPADYRSLKVRLKQETGAQKQEAKRRKALDRQVRKEQAKWDKELQQLQRQAEQEDKERRRQAQEQAVARVREDRKQPQPPAPEPPSGEPAPLATAAAPSEPVQPEAPAKAEAPAQPEEPRVTAQFPATGEMPTPVQLAPVQVTTAPAEPLAPSLVGHPRPPAGAVQINARQMSMSPDRKVALAQGDVEVIFEDAFLTCDRLTLFTDTKDVYAEGRVRLEQGNQVFRGEMVHYNTNSKKGRFLQGTVSTPPWHQHGRTVEHIAEGVYVVSPGYITSCELEPPHFRFAGRRAIVFSEDKLARANNVALFVEQMPFLYLPNLIVADRRSPFFIIPGKNDLWEQFALMGYRYEYPQGQKGTLRLDWRRTMGWGTGLDHRFESQDLGKGLLKLYYNSEPNHRTLHHEIVKGAERDRFRVLWRHFWEPKFLKDTTIITNIQKYSDKKYREELLFREEFTKDDSPDSFISLVTSDPNFTVTGLVRRRMNRFETITQAFPQLAVESRQAPIGETPAFLQSKLEFANLQTKTAHSVEDTDVVRLDWLQKFKYALNLFSPILVTPRADVRQTFYTKDIQSGTTDRPQGRRNLLSGQFGMGADASLKLFRLFAPHTDLFGLNLTGLRHVLTPTISYDYMHRPTVPNENLSFPVAVSPTNMITFGLENKLQTKRRVRQEEEEPVKGKLLKPKLKPVDLARALVSLPYNFHGAGNKAGGRVGDWAFDIELYPWPWMRLETDWKYPSHYEKGVRDSRITQWNVDLVMVGGGEDPQAKNTPKYEPPVVRGFEAGPRPSIIKLLMPKKQWFLGYSHRYSHNDKTEDTLQYDWRLSDKWEISTFHRFDWKEVRGDKKRFYNLREFQYALRRDLHDWIGELVYRVDREYGEELYLTLTLKAFPDMPVEMETAYHQPKIGSQSSPFSPLASQHQP